ncbi:Thaumatin [Corchorus capsularis]|uniref:Thaumatin n=1 Tax=Corchorus capsularis TaxID=210143 RepID=A0A1R3IH04_COCAP|nr:Thaumatin [Corchorus capsularis]
MKLYLLFGLSLALSISGAHMATISIKNNCPYTIWPGILTGNNGAQLGANSGFDLAQQATKSVDVPATWIAGLIWARTGCSSNSGTFSCATANCGSGQVACNGHGAAPPVTLAEFTLSAANNANQDTYDISNVDGFNLPLSISPQGGSGATCKTTSCQKDINAACPAALAKKGSDGATIACKSACVAFNEPQYCCTGEFEPRGACKPSTYSQFFKEQCPQAYSYAQDDQSSTFTCSGKPDYLVTFCP